MLISGSKFDSLNYDIELGQIMSMYTQNDSLKKTSQSGLTKEFRVLSSSVDSNFFVGITNDQYNEVYKISNMD